LKKKINLQDKMKQKVDKIKAHGINCFVNRQLIYNWPEQLFADGGLMAIEHADFDGVERLALVTGAEITSTFDHPELVKIGHCKLIEEIIIGEDRVKYPALSNAHSVGNASLFMSHFFFLTFFVLLWIYSHPAIILADQILRMRCWGGLHDCFARCHAAALGRGGAFSSRCSLRSVPDRP
jgi:hypothetical protein